MMGVIYVKSDAAGAANGTSWDDAYTTIQAAVTAVANGDTIEVYAGTYTAGATIGATQNGKSFTIHGGNSGEVIFTKSSGSFFVEQAGYASGSITISTITLTGSGTSTSHYSKSGASVLAFVSCNLGSSSAVGSQVGIYAGSSGSVTFTNCVIAWATNVSSIPVYSAVPITISGGTITASNYNFIYIQGNCAAITISGATIDLTAQTAGHYLITFSGAYSTGAVSIAGNTITASASNAICVTRGSSSVSITNNIITNTASSSAGVGIQVGSEPPPGLTPALGTITVTGNTVTFTGTPSAHGILIGGGVKSGTVSGNTVTNAYYGLVVKCDGVTFSNNLIIQPSSGGSWALYLRGGQNDSILNNTFYCPSGGGIILDTQYATNSENTDATAPPNLAAYAAAQTFSSITDGNIVLLAGASQPSSAFRVRIVIYNSTAGALNLYEGTTSYAVVGTYNGSPVSETITMTSTAGNKSVAAGKYRYKTSVNKYDSISSITVTNPPDSALSFNGAAGTITPVGHILRNNIVYLTPTNNNAVINDSVGVADGNADGCIFDYNCYGKGSGNLALLNFGGSPPTACANLAALQAAWATYSSGYPTNDAHSIAADPLFVNAPVELALKPSSPCRGVGYGSTIYVIDGIGTLTSMLPNIGLAQYSADTYVIRRNFNDIAGDHRGFFLYGSMLSNTATRRTATGLSWQFLPSGGATTWFRVSQGSPFTFRASAQANKAITLSAYVRKDASYNGSNAPRIVVYGGVLQGIAADVVGDSLTASADTWQKLSVTVTPTESGVLEYTVEGQGTAGSYYVDDLPGKVDDAFGISGFAAYKPMVITGT